MPSLFERLRKRIVSLFTRREPEIEITEIPEIQEIPSEPIIKEKPIIEEEKPEIEEEIPPEIEEKMREKNLARIAVFYERIRGTRIRRKVSRTFPLDTNDGEIQRMLESQYDNGGNFVIQIESISVGESQDYEIQELEIGAPGSADDSP